MKFRNPQNGFVDELSSPGLCCFFLGSLYFAVKGVWAHAIASFVIALCTMGISWLIYPFFASEIIRTSYLRRGWSEV
jgi:hypothetical protein